MLGGLAWTVKGGAILATGDQPPVLFALGPFLFATALIGLATRIGDDGGRRTRSGLVLASAGLVLTVVGWIVGAVFPDLESDDDSFTALSLVLVAAMLAILAALVLLGLEARRTRALPGRFRSLPLGIVTLLVLAMPATAALAPIDERLIELPLVVFALGWIALGLAMWRADTDPPTASTAAARGAA